MANCRDQVDINKLYIVRIAYAVVECNVTIQETLMQIPSDPPQGCMKMEITAYKRQRNSQAVISCFIPQYLKLQIEKHRVTSKFDKSSSLFQICVSRNACWMAGEDSYNDKKDRGGHHGLSV